MCKFFLKSCESSMATTTLDHITAWALLQKQKARLEDNLHRLFGTDHDSEALRTINTLWEAHTKAVGQLVGDEEQWLNYYEYECAMGKQPGSYKKSPTARPVRISSLKSLAHVIELTGPQA